MGAWLAYLNDRRRGKFDSLSAAQGFFRRPYYLRGDARIMNRRTGEAWKRVKGGWYKVTLAHTNRRRRAARN